MAEGSNPSSAPQAQRPQGQALTSNEAEGSEQRFARSGKPAAATPENGASPTISERPQPQQPETPKSIAEQKSAAIEAIRGQHNFQTEKENEWLIPLQSSPVENIKLIQALLKDGTYNPKDIGLLAELSTEALKNEISRQPLMDQILNDGRSTLEGRPVTKADLAKYTVDQLRQIVANYHGVTDESGQVAQYGLESFDALLQADRKRRKEDTTLESITDPAERRAYLVEQAKWLQDEVAQKNLARFKKDGVLDNHIKGVFLLEAANKVDDQIKAKYEGAARAEYQNILKMSEEQRKAHHLTDADGKVPPEAEFLERFVNNEKMNPEFAIVRQQEIDTELERIAQEAMDEDKPDSPYKGFFKNLALEVMKSMDIAFVGAADMDFATILRILQHVDANSHSMRGGIVMNESGEFIRKVEEDEMRAFFEGRDGDQRQLGKALFKAFETDELKEAEFKLLDAHILDDAIEGDPKAIREVMAQVLDHIFNASSEQDQKTRWAAFSKGFAESMYPGVHAKLDSKMEEFFKELHDGQKVSNSTFDLYFKERDKITEDSAAKSNSNNVISLQQPTQSASMQRAA